MCAGWASTSCDGSATAELFVIPWTSETPMRFGYWSKNTLSSSATLHKDELVILIASENRRFWSAASTVCLIHLVLSETHLTFLGKARCLCAPACWDPPPFVKHLSNAYYGLGSFSKLINVCSVLRNETVSLHGGMWIETCRSTVYSLQSFCPNQCCLLALAASYSEVFCVRHLILWVHFFGSGFKQCLRCCQQSRPCGFCALVENCV